MDNPKVTLGVVDPELQKYIRYIPTVMFSNAIIRRFQRLLLPLVVRQKSFDGISITTKAFGKGRGIRIYTPDKVRTDAALLWIHGGGYVVGAAIQDDILCAHIASTLGMVVYSSDYRVAPQAPFPAALDDVQESWQWVQKNATAYAVDRHKIVIGGQSAGGGLAAALVQRLHDHSDVQPVGQWLGSPMIDDRIAADLSLDKLGHDMWDNVKNRIAWRAYLGVEPGTQVVPEYAVPARRASLSGLPPTLLYVGDIELFHTEGVEYACRLQADGVEVELIVQPGAFHGFDTMAFETAYVREHTARCLAWLKQVTTA